MSRSITYNSPNVTSPITGEDRSGKIWGKLVPHGFTYDGGWFENSNKDRKTPWRLGANENTTISFSHDVKIEGQPIAAGTYGFFMATGEKEWTLVFSKRYKSWGSYFYDPSEDALRVNVKSEKSEFHQWLTFEFTNRKQNSTTALFFWENTKVPFQIEVTNNHDLYISKLKEELEGSNKIFYWYNWNEAANYCLNNKTHLDQGLEWAEKSISHPWVGEANFTTLKTKAKILEALNRKKEADSLMNFAIRHASTVYQAHNYGRELIAKGMKNEALEVFKLNAKNHPDTWPVQLGLARGYAEIGDYKQALIHINSARKGVPIDKFNKMNVEDIYQKIKKKEKISLYLYDDGLTQVF